MGLILEKKNIHGDFYVNERQKIKRRKIYYTRIYIYINILMGQRENGIKK